MSAGPGRIVFDGVWKRFRRGERVDTLRDLIPMALGRALRPGVGSKDRRDFWALRDVSFAVTPGRVVGLLGPNGAGKSTILKLATGLMEPTRGRIEVAGRIGALVELAAGFHPELTGRENVFLQGTVMGMSRAEIARRFDEIVAFAELEDFIDTPVKRYSSGMNARLGFSIAAHLDADVLLVDEVLSVGDMAFQQKAMVRLSEIVDRDIPVLIVSHQLERIAGLCDEALLLASGGVACRGTPLECIAAYVRGAHQPSTEEDRAGWARLDPDSLRPSERIESGETLRMRVEGLVRQPGVDVGIQVRSLPDGEVLFAAYGEACGVEVSEGRSFDLDVSLDMNLGPGVYGIQPYLLDAGKRWERWRGSVVTVRVSRARDAYGTVDLNPRMRRCEP